MGQTLGRCASGRVERVRSRARAPHETDNSWPNTADEPAVVVTCVPAFHAVSGQVLRRDNI